MNQDGLMVPPNASENMLLQHEDRLQELERLRPPHEALGNYQDVFANLYANLEDLRPHVQYVEDWVCMYLSVFQKMRAPVRMEQCWQILTLCRDQNWKMLAKFIYHACRLHNKTLVPFWRPDPQVFPDEGTDDSHSFTFTSETLPHMVHQMMA